MMYQTKVCKCNCKHDFQDERYGAGLRLCNPMQGSKGSATGYRCSVCGKVVEGSGSSKSSKPAKAE